jgi:fucose permease
LTSNLPLPSAEDRPLFFALLLNFALFGVTVTIIGSVVPQVIRQYDWSYIATGAVLAASSFGYFTSSFISGVLTERLGPKRVILLGLALQSLGLALFGMVESVAVNLVATLFLGLGQGATEVVTNFCVAGMERSGQSRLMNLMHAAFPVGAISGPVLTGTIMTSGGRWEMAFSLAAVLTLGMTVLLGLLRFGKRYETEREAAPKTSISKLVRNPLLIFLSLTILLYVGAEIGVSSWISEYFVKSFGYAPSSAAFLVSFFWSGILVGRVAVSVYSGFRQAELLLVLSFVSAISLVFSLLAASPVVASIGFIACGLGLSAIYPIDMALVGNNYRKGTSVAMGIVSTGGGLGSFSFPFLMAAIAQSYGIGRGFWFYAIVSVIMAGSAGAVVYLLRARKAERPTHKP